ncbi:hypothetical protein LCGC14_1524040 [marine sediment metagenome]|uniref:Uncharacterized protein n=1 Tax=marine sediment metagenome TaxID=412755 RepID=A0A0F9LYT4_9ZZZZ
MSIAVQIVCDGCGQAADCGIGLERLKTHAVRDVLGSNFGWETALLGGKDLCGQCVKTGQPVKPKPNLKIVGG